MAKQSCGFKQPRSVHNRFQPRRDPIITVGEITERVARTGDPPQRIVGHTEEILLIDVPVVRPSAPRHLRTARGSKTNLQARTPPDLLASLRLSLSSQTTSTQTILCYFYFLPRLCLLHIDSC
jgi:hypothetical protein